MEPENGPGSIRRGGNDLRVTVTILIAAALIFTADVLTPLGLSLWILYFIPLFLTLYLGRKNGPYLVTALIIVLTYASFFLSPPDILPLFALLNRIFFTFLIAAAALLIAHHQQHEEALVTNEENYRILAEWSPDAVAVIRNGTIAYANLAFLRLFAADESDRLAGRKLPEMVHTAGRELVRERIRQAAMGAQVTVPDVAMIRSGGMEIRGDLTFRQIVWERTPAVLVNFRIRG